MQYRKPHYYQEFSCIADRCPDTCCAGWQIVIDEESLEKYSRVKSEFGTRLLNSIDWSEGVFEQYQKRCSFLNEENLCDLYKELGADALCETCRMYPRHVEEFEGLREYSLSLSCPVAAEMILGCKEKVSFLTEEDELEECEEDYEDFDFLLFGALEEFRRILYEIVQNREMSMQKRMHLILKLSEKFQEALDAGELFELDLEETLHGFLQEELEKEPITVLAETVLKNRKQMLKDLQKLEVLREEWPEILERLDKNLYTKDGEFYGKCKRKFRVFTAENFGKEQWEIYEEQLLLFFVYTYFCGAVYDDMVYTKSVLAVFSVLWIEELLLGTWMEQGGKLDFSDIVKVSYQYAREIEHSDENLNMLEEIFQDHPLYSPKNLADTAAE